MGSRIRSTRPWVQFRAPAMGGRLLEMGARSSILSTRALPSMKTVLTTFRSCLYSSSRVMCFFSSSSWMMGRLSRASKESNSLNLPMMVSQSSKPWVRMEARRLSSSLILWRNLKKSSSNWRCSMSMMSYSTVVNSSTACWNSENTWRTVAERVLPLVLPMSIFCSLENCIIVLVRCMMSWQRSEKESRRTNRALVVIFHWFLALALYSK
mmetsp:Transcript_20734/g.31859  ORF Transcript_20734/g.31859 Transcript_20734/m.31859 type:complete len:210 (-) Transcript_20734:1115-1744(-)